MNLLRVMSRKWVFELLFGLPMNVIVWGVPHLGHEVFGDLRGDVQHFGTLNRL